MKHTTRILFAGLMLVITTLPVRAQYTYITNNGTITITGYTGTGGFVTIPSTINSLPVTSIGDNAFGNVSPLSAIDGITIPNSVTNIGNDSFYGNMSLFNVTLGSGLISIGNSAFFGCRFSSISLPNSLVTIGEQAFGNTGLTGITIPASVTNISGNPFPLCNLLGSIGVVTNNPAYTNVAGILFSKDLTTLVGYPTTKPNTSYVLSNGVTTIDDLAFDGCTTLTNIVIPSGVVSIGTNAFANCSGLANVTIPATVTNIGVGPFAYCGSLTAIHVDSNNPAFRDIAGVLYDTNMDLLQYPGAYPTNFFTLPNNTASIQASAFALSATLAGVMIPYGVTSVGQAAFQSCPSLTNVTLPDSVTNLGSLAFFNCSALTNVTLSSNLATIQPNTFVFSGLLSVTIPLGITDIENSAFSDTDLGSVAIPASVTNIENFAFEFCPALRNVVISASVSNLGLNAFVQCPNLAGVYFEGNAPAANPTIFNFDNNATVYYLPGTSGWGTNYDGRPTAVWQPAILTRDGSFGLRGGQFGFNISWASNLTVTVSANTDLTTTNWTALQSCTLTNGTFYFSDATASAGQKYYRLSFP